METFRHIEERFKDWHYETPKILYGFIRALRPRVVVEVGTYRGFAACIMATALKENGEGKLYCIDNFSLRNHCGDYGDALCHMKDNLVAAGVFEWVEIKVGDSAKVTWPDKIDMAFIDGFHSFKMAKMDFHNAARRGATFIALHDTESEVGPRAFVDSEQFPGWQRIDIHVERGLTIFVKQQERLPIDNIQEIPGTNGYHIEPGKETQKALSDAESVTGVNYFARLNINRED